MRDLRVISGSPSDEELAAIVVVLVRAPTAAGLPAGPGRRVPAPGWLVRPRLWPPR